MQRILLLYRDKGSIILCGDLNARVALSKDFLGEDNSSNFIPLPDELDNFQLDFPLRNTQDKKTNSHKNYLLDLLLHNNLMILNGRTLGDTEGKYTCFKWNGSSVVDYFICNPDFASNIRWMKVQDHTNFSDHSPLTLSLWNSMFLTLNITNINYENAPLRYKINTDGIDMFQNTQSSDWFMKDSSSIADMVYGTTADGIKDLNTDFINLLTKAADLCFDKSKPPKAQYLKHKKWFDWECRSSKRLLKKSCRLRSSFPDDSYIRTRHNKILKDYTRLIKSKKRKHIVDLNNKIQSGKIISWKDFNSLKDHYKPRIPFDPYDLNLFHNFYTNLYSDHHDKIDPSTKDQFIQEADTLAARTNGEETMNINGIFCEDELNACINKLKNGKSSSFDMICNEILKNLNSDTRRILLKLFNSCFLAGVYPWSNSLITPIYKKGDKSNPDNYRAIAICSCIGKLFSSMLLNRLIRFRKSVSPDPINQAGFTKGSQTNDHLFALHTITSKYKKLKKKVYAVFIDLRKAFDLVCRQALLLKLAKSGITGNFYNVLKSMYTSSTGHIKLSGKISDKFNIGKGTEQGHPLSPELFKVYFKDLSDLLNKLSKNSPELHGHPISHLAWADDVVIMSLDANSLQQQLCLIEEFCNTWGLEINTSKTKFMTFNKPNNGTKSAHNTQAPYINNHAIEEVSSYCYLGITIHANGSFSEAVSNLRSKALGAYYALRRTVDKSIIQPKNLCYLFDSLIKPILLYGSPIWIPHMPAINAILKAGNNTDPNGGILSKIANFPQEQVHLKFLKYLLSVHPKTSNVATWGDTGRYPVLYNGVKLTLDFFKRISSFSTDTLVGKAFFEQHNLNLPWYSQASRLIDLGNPPNHTQSHTTHLKPNSIVLNLKNMFSANWDKALHTQSKLSYYRTLKSYFAWEDYLDHIPNHKHRRTITRMRSSAHKLRIEEGRYENICQVNRICQFCKIQLGVNIIEDEIHFLTSCDLTGDMRNQHYATLNHQCTPTDLINDRHLSLNLSFRNNMSMLCAPRIKISRITAKTINTMYEHRLNFSKAINQYRRTYPADYSSLMR